MYEAKISTGKTPIIQDLSKRPWDLSAMKDSEVRAIARKNMVRAVIPGVMNSLKSVSSSPRRGSSTESIDKSTISPRSSLHSSDTSLVKESKASVTAFVTKSAS